VAFCKRFLKKVVNSVMKIKIYIYLFLRDGDCDDGDVSGALMLPLLPLEVEVRSDTR
ncbi:20197_t:CDS:1, partial [Racocetra persica]